MQKRVQDVDLVEEDTQIPPPLSLVRVEAMLRERSL